MLTVTHLWSIPSLLLLGSCVTLAQAQISAELSYQPPVMAEFSGVDNHVYLITTDPAGRLPLRCEAKGDPEPVYQWFKNDQLLTAEDLSGLSVTGEQNQTLEFTGQDVEAFSGYYHCEASNKLGTAKSEVILVTDVEPVLPEFGEKPEFAEEPETEIVEVGATAKFKCSAKLSEGGPHADLTWTKNGKVLNEYDNLHVLTIEKVSTSDIATYACNISNAHGYSYKTVYLNILNQIPSFIERPVNKTVSVGQETILRCTAKGHPVPSITWTFDEKPWSEFEDFKVSPEGDLRIGRVKGEHSEGRFVCIAENVVGQREAEAYLNVVSTTTIQYGPEGQQAQVFSDVKLNCTVLWDRNFDLTVEWKKDNVQIKADGQKFIIDEDNALVITNLEFTDSGVYTCVASTSTSMTADSGTLTVTGIPPTLVTGPPEMINIAEGSDVQILCKVDGYPAPKFTWYKGTNRLVVSGDRFTKLDDGSLRIRNAHVEDSAKYICRADNNYGEPVIVSSFVDIRKKTEVLLEPENAIMEPGGDAMLHCLVDIDKGLRSSTIINWYKDGEKLETHEETPSEYETDEIQPTVDLQTDEAPKYHLFANGSLFVSDLTDDDIGTYKCHVQTGVDEVVLYGAIVSREAGSLLWLILLIIICLLFLLLLIICVICVRNRSKKQGKYGVKDVENGKKLNGTLTEIDEADDVEGKQILLEKTLNTPIFTPKPIKPKDYTKGSRDSMLTDDMNLETGYNEDGSFRGKYFDDDRV